MNEFLKYIISVVDKASSPIVSLTAKARQFDNTYTKATKNANTQTQELSKTIAGVGGSFAALAGGITVLTALTVGIGSAVAETIDFSSQLSKVKAISRATDDQFNLLRSTALKLGSETQFTATQAGEGLQFLAQAGFNARQQVEALPSVLNLAAVSNISLGKSASITAGILSGFGLKASDTESLVDTLALTTVTSGTNMLQLAQAMNKLVPTARTLGISVAESSAIIGILADNNLKGSRATQVLASSFKRLSKPTAEMEKVLASTGIEIFDQTGKFIGFADVLQQVESATKDLSDEQRLAAISTIFGTQASDAINLLLGATKEVEGVTGSGAQALKLYTAQLERSTGEAQKMADVMNDNLKGDLIKAESAVSGLKIAFGSALEPVLRRVIQLFTASVGIINSNIGVFKVLVTGATLMAIAFTVLQAKLLLSSLAARFAASSFIRLSLAFLASPIGLIIAGLTLLGAAVVFAFNKFEGFRRVVFGVFEVMKGVFAFINREVVPVVIQMALVFFNLGKSIFSFFKGIFNTIKPFISGIVNFVIDKIKSFLGLLAKIPLVGKAIRRFQLGFASVGAGSAAIDVFGNVPGIDSILGTSSAAALTGAVSPGDSAISPAAAGVAGGGARPTEINITVEKFQDSVNFNVTNIEQSLGDVEEQFKEMFLRVINSANQIAVGN